MSDPIASQSPAGEEHSLELGGDALQFDQAEFETPAADRPTCTVCSQPIAEEYYEINGKVMCPRCRHGVEAAFRGGSGLGRFVKATVFGTVVAVLGAIIYYASVKLTGYNLSLISILVGFMVGKAVRNGTGNRGGVLYQLLAVFLTYSSIGLMLVSLVAGEFLKQQAAKPGPAPAVGKAGNAVDKAKADDKAKAVEQEEEPNEAPAAPPGGAALALALIAVIIFMYALPVLDVVNGPIAGLIYAFALWEAWKLNRPVQLVFNGPFRLAGAGPAEPKPEGVADGV
jgi:hypothetical protein